MIVSSSSQTIYGYAIWSPVDLLAKFLEDSPTAATRFGVSLNKKWVSESDEKVVTGLVRLCLFHCGTGRHHIEFPKDTNADFSQIGYGTNIPVAA